MFSVVSYHILMECITSRNSNVRVDTSLIFPILVVDDIWLFVCFACLFCLCVSLLIWIFCSLLRIALLLFFNRSASTIQSNTPYCLFLLSELLIVQYCSSQLVRIAPSLHFMRPLCVQNLENCRLTAIRRRTDGR